MIKYNVRNAPKNGNILLEVHFNHRSLIDYTAKQRKAKLSVTGLPQKKVQVDFLEPLFKKPKK